MNLVIKAGDVIIGCFVERESALEVDSSFKMEAQQCQKILTAQFYADNFENEKEICKMDTHRQSKGGHMGECDLCDLAPYIVTLL